MSVLEQELKICNRKGLHARAAAAFVKCVSETASDVTVEKDGQVVDGSSILSLMMLAASQGTVIKVRADGDDASDALQKIALLVNSCFGEEQ
ncbi:MAG: HPr family phosphocarrier protein [Alphaproteobacteria bacterium]|nr:HPr family phosphocarrier protein [Alphaproteobacteria bacterium]